MKNLKVFFPTLLLVVLFSASSYAQDGTGNVVVNAQLVGAITVTNNTEVSFGGITQGSSITAVLDANVNDPATEANVGAGATPGLVTISGTASSAITVSYTGATLEETGGDQLEFTPSVFLTGTSTAVTSGSSQSLDGSGDLVLDIGGSLTVEASDVVGIYNTTISGSPMVVNVNYE